MSTLAGQSLEQNSFADPRNLNQNSGADIPLSKVIGESENMEETTEHQFRNYEDSERHEVVRKLYAVQHKNMTMENVKAFHEKHLKFDKCVMGIWEALEYLDKIVDQSDPDTEASQIQHALQSAEAARKEFPELRWMHLVCLIHDLGKILTVTDESRGLVGEPQWAVVGDTFPVGCHFETSNVHHDAFAANPDAQDERYNTKCGIYQPNCGLDNVTMSWGHDEYMYQVLVHNTCNLPPQALAIVRYHSFYPWHKSSGYTHLTSELDEENLKWIKIFNKFDLYSKIDEQQDVEALKPYYQDLIREYFPDKALKW